MMEPEAGSLPVLEADPGASPASCFLLRLLSTGATRERPRLGPWGWGWGCTCTSSIFLMERRKHMGRSGQGLGVLSNSQVGQDAQLGEVGTKEPSRETLMRVPDQDKDVVRTHEPALRKSTVIKRRWAQRKPRWETLELSKETRGWGGIGRG